MSLLLPDGPVIDLKGARNLALLHQLECRACPLNSIKVGGKIEPTGAEAPLIYVLGEAAGKQEAEEREQFVGESGQLLRSNIPRAFKDRIRFNNVIRTRPPGNRTPERTEIEACRPSVSRDIERTKPKAIFGFGNVPLDWVSGFSGITMWRGRRMPVKVGSHTCWFYPMLHPAYLLRQRKGQHRDIPSEEERMFKFDLKRAFAEVEKLPPAVVHGATEARATTEIITGVAGDIKRVRQALVWASRQPVIGIDYETNGIRPYNKGSRVLSAAVATGERAAAIAFDHPEAQWNKHDRDELQLLWTQFLRHAKGIKVAHNLVFELEWTAEFVGEDLVRAGRWDDTATQACILDERKGKHKPGCFSLEFLVQQHFGFNIKKLAGVNRADLINTPLETVLYYNAPDARYAALLWDVQDKLIKQEGLEEAQLLGLRRVPTVVLSQRRGVPLDQEEVARLHKKYTTEIADTLKQIAMLPAVQQFKKLKGVEYNVDKNQQTLVILRDILKRKEIRVLDKWTKEYKESTDESVLLQIDHPFTELLLRYRKFHKRHSVYVEPLRPNSETSVVYDDTLLHPQFNTIFAETARFSCEGPNLQNFPKRDKDVGAALSEEDGKAIEVRKPIIAAKGCMMLAFDLGQIEARVIAMFTKDKRFCKALWENYDVHHEWAERLAYAYPARVGGRAFLKDKGAMKTFRTDVKNQWTFPLFFGAKLSSAAGYLKMPEDIIAPLYDEFWDEFSGVEKWQKEQVKFYNENGYVACLTGRRRRGPLSLNQVLNSPVQGTAAEIIADCMARLSESGDPELQPELNIHDDLTFLRVPEKRVDLVAEKVIDAMLKPPFEWARVVPLTVEMSLGRNWLDMEDVAVFSSDTWGK